MGWLSELKEKIAFKRMMNREAGKSAFHMVDAYVWDSHLFINYLG